MPPPPIRLELPTPFAVGPVNAWLLPGDAPTLVDTGPRTDAAWEALTQGLSAHGLAPRDLHTLFLTHSHVDHYGNAQRLAEAAPALRIVAADMAHARATLTEGAAEWARHEQFARLALQVSGLEEAAVEGVVAGLRWLQGYGSVVPVAQWLQPGEWLPLADGTPWQIVALPGHSMTQAGLWQPERAQLIAGDHLLPTISSNALLEPPAPGQQRRPRALPRYVESLHWTAALPPQHLFPGHGKPFVDQRPLIARRLQGIEERAAALLAALRVQPRPIVALVAQLFPHLPNDQLLLAISEVVGHLDLLEARGAVTFEGHTVRLYRATPGA